MNILQAEDAVNGREGIATAEINGEIYYIKGDGLYKASENQKYECLIPFDEPNTRAFLQGKRTVYILP